MALRLEAHLRHATKGHNNRRTSLESVHDRVHVAIGGMVASVSKAAFNPIFFLLHCNVDRIYESYLNDNEDSQREFASNQVRMTRFGASNTNMFTEPLLPFKLKGQDIFPADTFDTTGLGWVRARHLGTECNS